MAKRGKDGLVVPVTIQPQGSIGDLGTTEAEKKLSSLDRAIERVGDKAISKFAELNGVTKEVADTLLTMANGKDVARYFDEQATSIENLLRIAKHINGLDLDFKFGRMGAEELQKLMNAFEAKNGAPELKKYFADIEEAAGHSISEIKSAAKGLDSAFSTDAFETWFRTIERLQEAGASGRELLDLFGNNNIRAQAEELRSAREQVDELQNSVASLSSEIERLESGEGVQRLKDQLKEARDALNNVTNVARGEFESFIQTHNLGGFLSDSSIIDERTETTYKQFFRNLFNEIDEGSKTSQEAIAEVMSKMSQFFDTIDSSAVDALISKFEQLVTPISEISTKLDALEAKLNAITDNGGIRQTGTDIANSAREGASALSQEGEALQHIADKGDGIRSVADALANLANTGNTGINETKDALLQLIEAVQKLGEVDNSRLANISNAFASLSDMNGFTASKKATEEIAKMLERIASIPDVSSLKALSGVDLTKFKMSRASLEAMATNLPTIANPTIVSSLESLAKIDWTNLNSLHVTKANMANLGDLASKVGSATRGQAGDSAIPVTVKPVVDNADLVQSIQEQVDRASVRVKLKFSDVELLPGARDAVAKLFSHAATLTDNNGKKVMFDPGAVQQIDAYADAVARAKDAFDGFVNEHELVGDVGHLIGNIGDRTMIAAEGLANALEILKKNFQVENIKGSIADASVFDDAIVKATELDNAIKATKEELNGLYNNEGGKARRIISFNEEEAITRSKTGVRGLGEEFSVLSTNASEAADQVQNAGKTFVAESSKVKDASETIAEAFTFKFDETSLSGLSQTIQDAIQKASQNIKLTIDNVELSAKAQQALANKIADAASDGTKTKTGGATGGVAQELKEEAVAADAAADAKKRDAVASKEVAEANREVVESAKEAASAEKEMGEAGASEINIAYVQQLIKLYEQLSVWKTKNDSAYKDNQAVVDSIMYGTKNAITEAQGAIDAYLANVRESGTVTEETFIGVRAAIAQITGETAARNAETAAASKAAEEAAKKQKVAVQEIVDLYEQWYSAEANKLNAAKQHEQGEVEYWRKQQNELKVLVGIAEEAYPELAKLAKANDTVTEAIERRDKAQRTLDSKRSKESVAQLKANAEELEKYQKQLDKLNNWKGISFMKDDKSMERWNAEVEKTQELLDKLSTAEGKARIPIIEELKNQLGTMESLRNEFNQIITYTKQLNGIGVDASKMKFSGDTSMVAQYEAQIQKVKDAIENLRTADATHANEAVANVQKEISALEGLKNKFNDAAASATNLGNAEQAAQRLSDKIDIFLQKNGRLSSSTVAELNKLKASLAGMDAAGVRNAEKDFASLQLRIKKTGESGQSFFQQLKAGWSKFGGWSIVSRSFMSVIRIFKQAVTAVKEVDAAMTELKKVTDETTSGYERFYNTAVKMASKVGAKLSDVVQSASDFARLGYSLSDATELTEAALLYQNVADGLENVSDATSSLISTIKAFGSETYSAMEIVDMFNEVGKTLLPMPVVTRCLVECYIGQSSIALCA